MNAFKQIRSIKVAFVNQRLRECELSKIKNELNWLLVWHQKMRVSAPSLPLSSSRSFPLALPFVLPFPLFLSLSRVWRAKMNGQLFTTRPHNLLAIIVALRRALPRRVWRLSMRLGVRFHSSRRSRLLSWILLCYFLEGNRSRALVCRRVTHQLDFDSVSNRHPSIEC